MIKIILLQLWLSNVLIFKQKKDVFLKSTIGVLREPSEKNFNRTWLYTSANLLFPTRGEPKLYMVTDIKPLLYTILRNKQEIIWSNQFA